MKTFTHVPVELGYGDLTCETLPTGRRYLTPQGKWYPSITTVLGIEPAPELEAWKARVGEAEANRVGRHAAYRGEKLHTAVERHLKNDANPTKGMMPNVVDLFGSIRPILDADIDDVLLQEKPLYSDHLEIAGRVDLVAKYRRKRSIVDIKSSARVKTKEDIISYFIQEAAYAIMVEERTGLAIEQLVTIMAVEYQKPIVFIENRDNWTKDLKRLRAEYRKIKGL